MDRKKRGCLWAALGVAVLVVVVGLGLVGGMVWLVYQDSSLQKARTTPEAAARKLAQARARFTAQRPLVTIDARGKTTVTPRDGHGRVPESLHVLTWGADEGELVELRFPFWLLRLGGAKAKLVTGNDALRDLEGSSLTVDDVEKAGPGLLLEHIDAQGRTVLVWTE